MFLPSDIIKQVAGLTAQNAHTEARVFLSRRLVRAAGAKWRAQHLLEAYECVQERQAANGFLDIVDSHLSGILDRELKEALHWVYENGHEVWSAL